MLEFLLSADYKSAKHALLGRLLSRIEAGEEGQILLVPEQISFETERQLCRLGGDSVCRYAEVLSFSRLAERVAAEYGGVANRYLDRGGRLLAAAQAVEHVLSRIKLFAPVCKKPEFLEAFLQAVDEFGNYGLTADLLLAASKRETGQFAQKLEELGLLLESYSAVTAQAQDPICRLQHLLDRLTNEDYAAGKTFYIFGFTDFTRLELQIVCRLLLTAKRVVIALPQEKADGCEVFPSADATRRALLNFCNAHAIEAASESVPFSSEPADLTFVQRRLTACAKQTPAEKIEHVACVQASDKDGECRMAIAEIRRLLRGGARLREIAIACQDEQTLPLLQSMLEASELPYYTSRKQPLPEHGGARIVLSAVRAAASGLERDDVIDYVKSGAAGLTEDDCDRVENYAIIWNLNGAQWEKEWTYHPRGLGREWSDEDTAALKKLNALREKAITPLTALKAALAKAETVGQMAEAVYHLMTAISFSERMQRRADAFYEAGDFLRAQQYAQICELLQNALEQMDLILHDCVRTPDAFYRLFEKLIGCYAIGAIPASVDRIALGTAKDFRALEIPHLLILDADEAHFPAAMHHSGVFTEAERLRLLAAGVPMAPGDSDAMERELSGVYLSIRAACKTLYVSYVGDSASFIVQRIGEMAGLREQQPTLLPLTETEAAALYLQYGKEPPSREVSAAAERLRERRGYRFGAVDPVRTKALYGKEISLSATRIESYCSCRFQYFMRYGLKANPRKEAVFDASAFGTFAHKVLEDTARTVMERGGFHKVAWEEVREIAVASIQNYRETVLQGLEEQARFREAFRRNTAEVLLIVEDLVKELSDSDFEPFAFELLFDDQGGTLPAIHASGDVASCKVVGSVDRADRYTDGGKTYVRVVDYKTGKKDFDYADLTLGMGMQMLIYLFALRHYGAAAFGMDFLPAGVLYHPAKTGYISGSSRPTKEAAEEGQIERHRRKGLILSDERIEHAMEHFDGAPRYLPLTLKKKTAILEGDVATEEEFARLERFVFFKLGEIADRIACGCVDPNPVLRDKNHSSCTYCDYKDVCQKDFAPHDDRPIQAYDNSKFFAYLASWEDAHG